MSQAVSGVDSCTLVIGFERSLCADEEGCPELPAMAFSNTLNGRMDELRFPTGRVPDTDSSFAGAVTSPRDSHSSLFYPGMTGPGLDARGPLQRRFTTDSSKVSMAKPFGPHYSSFNSTSMKQKQLYDDIQDARRKAQEQLALLDLQERNLQMSSNSQDVDRLSNGFNRVSLNGPVSEPTTPPDYSEDVFHNRFSRSSRVSGSAILSPPGLPKRTSQSSSKMMSPQSNRHSNQGLYSAHRQSTKSMPGSRRGSDEDEYYPEDLPAVRSAATFNRFSMPVNGSRNGHRLSMSAAPVSHHGPTLLDTSFLLEADEDGPGQLGPVAQAYAQLGGDDFPTLNMEGGKLSANSAALDLANPKSPDSEWTVGSRAHRGHASMPHTDSSMYRPVLNNVGGSAPMERPSDLPRRKSQRHSVGVSFDDKGGVPPVPTTRPASLQTSYSTNDVPTVKNNLDHNVTNSKSQAEHHFHAHNVSLGRIPANAVNNRQSRELASANGMYRVDDGTVPVSQSSLQASAAPFGPAYTSTTGAADNSALHAAAVAPPNYGIPPPMYSFNMSTYQTGNIGPLPANNNTNNPVTATNAAMLNMANGYNLFSARPQDAPTRANGRRHHDEARFNNVPLETYRNNLYELCKDQHGCRYLQRKLEDGHPDHVQMIFEETCPHITELMTDPFGNYLCQKLFEHCNEAQRTTLINTAAPALTVVALNQHGTRALQKMIEFVRTDHQIDVIIQALSHRVVDLVQDLNGNHVIQKCLTRLGAERSQFIYDAVGNYCIVVGTHRHGCCVLQRCIDHSQGEQRAQLIHRITNCAFDLVQDPFGNYVVQYILDLDEIKFTTPLCESFRGKIVALSKQKFSSNVIEKCLRTAAPPIKRMMVEEMLNGNDLESMLRDSFANYVVQTAMDYVDAEMRAHMVEVIRPILPAIKQTPHGRRIASKIMNSADQGRVSGTSSGAMTPTDNFGPAFPAGRSNRRQIQIVGGGFNRAGFTNNTAATPAAAATTYHQPGDAPHTTYQATDNPGFYNAPGMTAPYGGSTVAPPPFGTYQTGSTDNYI